MMKFDLVDLSDSAGTRVTSGEFVGHVERFGAPFRIKPGHLFIPRISCTGGLSVRSVKTVDNAGKVHIKLEATKDNADAHKMVAGLQSHAYYVLDAYAQDLPIGGYYVDEEMLKKVKEEFKALEDAVKSCNDVCAGLHSSRRIKIQYCLFTLDNDNHLATSLIYDAVSERLKAVLDALRSGDKKETVTTLSYLKNAVAMLTDPHASVVRRALAAAKDAKLELYKLLREGADPLEAGRKLYLSPLEHAVNLFGNSDPKTEVN